MSNLLARKPLETLLQEAGESGEHSLKRVLGPLNLVTFGIGMIIGAGIFVLTGAAAATFAGPAIVLSFVFAGVGCAFAGLCYAEFASLIPVAGSAYTYGYATLGELFAWIIGWDLILEYAFGAASVASGWAGTVNAFLQSFGIYFPPAWTDYPGRVLVFYNQQWTPLDILKPTLAAAHVNPNTLPHVTAIFNILAFFAIVAVTTILIVGIKETANFNTFVVFCKVLAVIVFIIVAAGYLLRHPSQAATNWHPFIPPNAGAFGSYGWSGIARGAAVFFFAFIGFDAVSTCAQEAKNPQRDMPIGILGSLVICTILYILVSGLLTGLMPYSALNVAAPVSLAIAATGVRWGGIVVNLGAIVGLSAVMLVMLLGQSRVFFSMSNDGLLPRWAAMIHPRFRTPWISSIIVGIFVAFFAATIPIAVLGQLVNIGTLLAFIIVCAGVWILRKRSPELHRPFKTPWVPVVPLLGILISLALMASLPLDTWIRLIVWLAIGLAIYFGYSRKNSRVQLALKNREERATAD